MGAEADALAGHLTGLTENIRRAVAEMRRAIQSRAPVGSEDTRSFVAPAAGAFSMEILN